MIEQRVYDPMRQLPLTKGEALEYLEYASRAPTIDTTALKRTYLLLSDKVPEFVREERYVVIKLKDLSSIQKLRLNNFLSDTNISTRAAVVVEKDWPEYEVVWDMLARRFRLES